jgi:hypothetical protein
VQIQKLHDVESEANIDKPEVGVTKADTFAALYQNETILIQKGIDRTGMDFKFSENSNFEECKKECIVQSNCVSFVYIEDAKSCWLKYGVPSTMATIEHRVFGVLTSRYACNK